MALARLYSWVTLASLHDFRLRSAGFEPIAVLASLKDVGVAGESIEQGRGRLGLADLAPFRDAEVGGDGEVSALEELAEQIER